MVSRVVPLTLTQVLYRGAGARKEALNPFTASAGGPRKWVHSGLTPTVDLRQHLVSGPRVNTSHLEHITLFNNTYLFSPGEFYIYFGYLQLFHSNHEEK